MENIAILSLMAKLKDNSNEITKSLNAQIDAVEKKADKIEVNINQSNFSDEMNKVISNILSITNGKLKNINLTKYLKSLVNTFADPTKSAEDYLKELTSVRDELNMIASAAKDAGGYDLFRDFNGRDIASALSAYKKVLDYKDKMEKSNKDFIENAKTSSDMNAYTTQSLKSKYTKEKNSVYLQSQSQERINEIASLYNIKETKESKAIIKNYSEILALYDLMLEKRKALQNFETEDDAKEYVRTVKTLSDLNTQILDLEKQMSSIYNIDSKTLISKSLSKTYPNNITQAANKYAKFMMLQMDTVYNEMMQQFALSVRERASERLAVSTEKQSAFIKKNADKAEKKYKKDDMSDGKDSATDKKQEKQKNYEKDKNTYEYTLAFDRIKEKYASLEKYAVSAEDALCEVNKLLKKMDSGNFDPDNDKKDLIGFVQRLYDLDDDIFTAPEEAEWYYDDNVDNFKHFTSQITEMTQAQVNEIAKIKAEKTPTDDNDTSASSSSKNEQDIDELEKRISSLEKLFDKLNEGAEKLSSVGEAFESAVNNMNSFSETLQYINQNLESVYFTIGNTDLAYHSGDLDHLNETKKPESWTDRISSLEYNYGAWGSGTYLTKDIEDLPTPGGRSGRQAIYAVDLSKYNLYQNKTNEQAEKLNNYLLTMEKFILSSSDFRGFDDDLKDISIESLYNDFSSVFSDIDLKFQEFQNFITEMQSLVKSSNIDENGIYHLQDLSLEGSDSIPTRFMKMLGYQGINNSGLSHYDNVEHGSVIYDLDQSSPYLKKFTTMDDIYAYNQKFLESTSSLFKIFDIDASKISTLQQIIDSIDVRQGNSSKERSSNIEDTHTSSPEYTSDSESSDIDRLNQSLSQVVHTIDEKTNAFKTEADVVEQSVTSEISNFDSLIERLRDAVTYIQELQGAFETINSTQGGDLYNGMQTEDLYKLHDILYDIYQRISDINATPVDLTLNIESIKDLDSNELKDISNLNVSDSITSEFDDLSILYMAIEKVRDAINLKTEAFKVEENVVETSVKNEVSVLSTLHEALTNIQSKIADINSVDIDARLSKESQSADSTDDNDSKNSSGSPKRKGKSKKVDSNNTIGDIPSTYIRDVTVAYDKAVKVNNALNSTKTVLNDLDMSFKGSRFFSSMADDIDKLDTKLKAGKISLVNYEKSIESVVKEYQTKYSLVGELTQSVYDAIGTSKLNEIPDIIMVIQNRLSSINEDFIRGTTSQSVYKKSVEDLCKSIKKSTGYFESEKDALEAMTRAAHDWDKKADVTTRRLPNGDRQVIAKTGNNSQSFVQTYRDSSHFVEQIVSDTKEGTNTFRKFFDSLKGKWADVFRYFMSFGSIYEVFDIVKQGFSIIVELDDALTEMNKVSDESIDTLQRFQKASFDMASSVGTTGVQLQSSTADFMRLGETLDEAQESAKTANILLNVSEFDSIDSATTSLIAMSSAYAELDKMDIIDKLNNVGNNFSISTDGIATALQSSASALTTAGNDIDEAIALITAGNAVVQDPNSVGAGLKTISLRITGTEAAKSELESLGEDTSDFVVQTSAKSQEAIKNFTKVAANNFKGFDILDDNGNFKSTFEIMLGISEIYDDIVESDKKYGSNMANGLLETLAGKNRANIAASILQNPDLLKDVYTSSQNSSGSALEENQKYLDSISGHIDVLKNKWQELWSNTGTRDAINGVIDLGTALLEVVDNIGLIQTALTSLLGFFTAKNFLTGEGFLINLLD